MLRASHTSRLAPIGVFDSGVGGLSVLRALHQHSPEAELTYIADSGHAPYGDRDPAHVVERSIRVTERLLAEGVGMVVVACNTATAWAITTLRERFPTVAWVGVEPGIKPAVARSRNHRVGVMATPATLASERFQRLLAAYAGRCEIHSVACTGLAAAIEQGSLARPELDHLLNLHCAPLHAADVDTVVLGCTHYPLVAPQIAQRFGPEVHLLDTADAIARHALQLCPHRRGSGEPGAAPGSLRLMSSGHDLAVIKGLTRTHLGLNLPVEHWPG